MSDHYDIASLEEEVRSKNYTKTSVFGDTKPLPVEQASPTPSQLMVSVFGHGPKGAVPSNSGSREREPNRQHTSSREHEARQLWRPKKEGDFTVEVKKSRSISRPTPTTRGPGMYASQVGYVIELYRRAK